MTIHNYLISFSYSNEHNTGFGNAEINIPNIIDDFKDIKNIQNELSKKFLSETIIVILYYKLISITKK
jgi:hypothetical protein